MHTVLALASKLKEPLHARSEDSASYISDATLRQKNAADTRGLLQSRGSRDSGTLPLNSTCDTRQLPRSSSRAAMLGHRAITERRTLQQNPHVKP